MYNDMMTDFTKTSRRPIGFWLKLVDRHLEDGLDEVLATNGLTRRDWQTLNAVRDGASSPSEVETRLAPFLEESEAPIDVVVEDLIADGWLEQADSEIGLTESGRARYEDLIGRVAEFRRGAVAGVSDDEYCQTVAVLERMATNLGWTA